MKYDVKDDLGVFVVVPKYDGRWAVMADAQDECDDRNFKSGVTDEQGVLLEHATKAEDKKFEAFHLTHSECTCEKRSKYDIEEHPWGESRPKDNKSARHGSALQS
jgi:hypothetical protein